MNSVSGMMTVESTTRMNDALDIKADEVMGICDENIKKQESLKANEVKRYEDTTQDTVFAMWDVER
jgi:hypothetical protein